MHICLFFTLLFFSKVFAYKKFTLDGLEVKLGESEGLDESSIVSQDNLRKILSGVEAGNKENIYFYALLKLYGISMSKDLMGAAENFLRASNLGHKEATTAYGVMLMSGSGVDKHNVNAVKVFRKGVELGDMNSHWLLGKMLLDGKGVDKPSYSEAAALFRKAVDANVPQAQHSLALMYEYGLGVEQNFDLAIKYYRKATELNHVESIYNLALMYAFARGVAQDFARARSLLETAAKVDHAPSIYYIGIFKTYGYGCKIDYNQAVNWFERAAGLDDFRVSLKAKSSAEELRTLIANAQIRNEALLDQYQKQAESYVE